MQIHCTTCDLLLGQIDETTDVKIECPLCIEYRNRVKYTLRLERHIDYEYGAWEQHVIKQAHNNDKEIDKFEAFVYAIKYGSEA